MVSLWRSLTPMYLCFKGEALRRDGKKRDCSCVWKGFVWVSPFLRKRTEVEDQRKVARARGEKKNAGERMLHAKKSNVIL